MATQQELDTELWEACCDKENLNEAKSLLLCGANCCATIKGKSDNPPIHQAILKSGGSTEILEAFFTHGKVRDINVKTSKGNTPLMQACFNGHVKCAKLLMDKDADATVKNIGNNSVIHLSVVGGSAVMVTECLKWSGVKVNERGFKNKIPLIFACEKGFANIVSVILAAGADIHLTDDDEHPAAWYARKNKEIMDILIKHSDELKEPSSTATSIATMSLGSNNAITRLTTLIKKVLPDLKDGRKMKSVLPSWIKLELTSII